MRVELHVAWSLTLPHYDAAALPDDFQASVLAIFAELERLLPEGMPANTGFSLTVELPRLLAALRALPDDAGEAAVLHVLGYNPDEFRRDGAT